MLKTLHSRSDQYIVAVEAALRTLSGSQVVNSSQPASGAPLSDSDRRLAAALMRVNHVGEVCAQAMYQAQALTAGSDGLRGHMLHAANEEASHLRWTEQRLRELGGRPSALNPFWYAGAFAFGWVAGRAGEHWSLGFVAETERQVEEHLSSHLDRLPPNDSASRTIVKRMKIDESRHAQEAQRAGARDLPLAVRWAMRGAAKVMTTVAARL